MRYIMYFLLSLQELLASASNKNISQVYVIAGEVAHLKCKSTTFNGYSVWKLNTQTLVDGKIVNKNSKIADRIKLQKSSESNLFMNNLLIINTTKDDSGLYCCLTIEQKLPREFCTQLEINSIVHTTGALTQPTEKKDRDPEGSNKYLTVWLSAGVFFVNLSVTGLCCYILWNKKIKPHTNRATANADNYSVREIHETQHVYHIIEDDDVRDSKSSENSIITSNDSAQVRENEIILDNGEAAITARSYTNLVEVLPSNIHKYETPQKTPLQKITANENQASRPLDSTNDMSCRELYYVSSEKRISAVYNLSYDIFDIHKPTETLEATPNQYQRIESHMKDDNKLDISVANNDFIIDDISLD